MAEITLNDKEKKQISQFSKKKKIIEYYERDNDKFVKMAKLNGYNTLKPWIEDLMYRELQKAKL